MQWQRHAKVAVYLIHRLRAPTFCNSSLLHSGEGFIFPKQLS
jgi:hypothetical protein